MEPTVFPAWSLGPFVGLLFCIALFPLAAPHWWEPHKNKAKLGLILALPALIAIFRFAPQEFWPTLKEYAAFIILLGSLFVVTGGIILEGNPKATPAVNTLFLALGAVLANLIGTTGASMVLIRPLLRSNQERQRATHVLVFFIFLVSNIGGCLTPLGDPPLFLGFLKGVPFFWTLSLWPEWLFAVGTLLGLFFFLDSYFWRREAGAALRTDREPLRVRGRRNFFCLAAIVGAVFLNEPWRELVMVLAGAAGFRFTPADYRKKNAFTFAPLAEVAILFGAIFITMVPALGFLRVHAPSFGVTQPWQFFWASGTLSSFLDNAPTYLTFLSLAQGLNSGGAVVGVSESVLRAISLGAVFMGANTYIGNGPNFMVKAIAEAAGVRMPSFLGYMKYSLTILLPLFILITLIFLF